MTVSSELNRKTFAMDAVTTSFGTSPVVFYDTSDLLVYAVLESTGAATLLTENTHYTVSGGNGSTGTVSTAGGSSPYGAGSSLYTLVIVRDLTLTQEVDFVNNDPSDADVAEQVADRLVMIAQQLQGQIDLSFRLASSDVSGASLIVPTPSVGKLIGWDSAGTGLQNYASSDLGTIVPSAFIATLLDDGDAITARTTLGVETSALTEDTAPSLVNDFAHVYDASAAALKKDRLINLGGPSEGVSLRNGYLDWTVSGNALTCAIKTLAGADPSASDPVFALVRNATVTTGAPTEVKITAATSVVVSSGSTLGTRNAIPFRVWAVLFDDAGTYRLGVINCVTTVAGAGTGSDVTAIYPLAGWAIAGSTAEGGAGAADSAQVFYTGTAVSAKAYSALGYATWESGQATAGTWATAASRKHLRQQGDPLPGQTLQIARSQSGAATTGTTQTPHDDTIPQITEGDQYMTQAITPTSAANALAIRARFVGANTGSTTAQTVAIHQDAVSNALAATVNIPGGGGSAITEQECSMAMLAATTGATTLRVRVGTSAVGTTTFNGTGGARTMGGAMSSILEVEEIMG